MFFPRALPPITAALAAILAIALPSAASPAAALPAAPASPPLAHADLADLTLAAPVIVRATITGTERIADKASPGLKPGRARLLITAAVDAAIVAPGAIPASLSWLWEAPTDARGKPPKPKGSAIIAWIAMPAADGKTRLVSGRAQQPLDPAIEARTRTLATEARTGTVPIITGVANGFRAEGTVPGESESQFFITAADGKGLTMVVTTRPGQARRIAMARGDVIDESAMVVKPDTLLRYRLACFLPAQLPMAAGGADPALAGDWRAAIAALGSCGRTTTP